MDSKKESKNNKPLVSTNPAKTTVQLSVWRKDSGSRTYYNYKLDVSYNKGSRDSPKWVKQSSYLNEAQFKQLKDRIREIDEKLTDVLIPESATKPIKQEDVV